MNRQSIRFRLTALYCGILATTLVLVGAGVWLAIRNSINETADSELRTRLENLRESLKRGGGKDARTAWIEELAENAEILPGGTHLRIADAEGRWLFQSKGTTGWGAAPPVATLPFRGKASTILAKGKPIRVLSAPLAPGLVQIGLTLEEFEEMLAEFSWTALMASPIVLFLASAGGYWMSRHALAPVERIALAASEIQVQKLASRLPLRGTGDELDHLSEVLNAMLGRLEESFHRIKRFTADASHELRTPVAIIRMTAEVTSRQPRTGAEYAEALNRILIESERTTELIEDLMLLARADGHVESGAFEPVKLDETVRAASAAIRPLAERAGLVLAVESLPRCVVSGEETALRRLLLILLDNAVKYSRPGGEIRVRLKIIEEPPRRLAFLEVEDKGIGIAAEDLSHIFERFYRASKDRSRNVDGIGLGLSIAQHIVDQHSGAICVNSNLGDGSTFRVTLPLADGQA